MLGFHRFATYYSAEYCFYFHADVLVLFSDVYCTFALRAFGRCVVSFFAYFSYSSRFPKAILPAIFNPLWRKRHSVFTCGCCLVVCTRRGLSCCRVCRNAGASKHIVAAFLTHSVRHDDRSLRERNLCWLYNLGVKSLLCTTCNTLKNSCA